MARIFISYKRQDKDIVFPIVEEIKQKTGVDCWIDLEGIESGDQFQNVIIDAIDNADIVVFMLSRNFIAPYRDEITGEIDLKKQTFPEKEVMYALRHNKRLIPISIDGTMVYDCKWLEFNCSGLDCIGWGVEEQQIKLLNNLRQWTGNKHTTNAILNTHHSSGTFVVESHPGYACLHINVDETCKVYRFGKQIGEIKGGDWGELYLRMGKHELTFVSEKNLTITNVIEIPSAEYTDFIHIEFSKNEVEENGTKKSSSSIDRKQGLSFSINALRKNKGCSIALTVAFVLCIVVLPLGYLSFERNGDTPLIADSTNGSTTEKTSNENFTENPDMIETDIDPNNFTLELTGTLGTDSMSSFSYSKSEGLSGKGYVQYINYYRDIKKLIVDKETCAIRLELYEESSREFIGTMEGTYKFQSSNNNFIYKGTFKNNQGKKLNFNYYGKLK